MKRKKILLIIVFVIGSIMPIQAKEKKNILLVSDDLPFLMYIEVINKKQMRVNVIPTAISIPIACASDYVSPLSSLKLMQNIACAKKSVENFFKVSIEHTVYVDMKAISNDTGLKYKSSTFNTLGGITDYFAKVLKKMNISMILNYQSYIISTLGIGDYYDYYHMFKGGNKVNINYGYVNTMETKMMTFPLDNRFHYPKK